MYLILILIILIAGAGMDVVVEWLNLRHMSPQLPTEFQGILNSEKYQKSQHYLYEHTRLGIIKTLLFTILIVGFLVTGGFNALDLWVREFQIPSVFSGVMYIAILAAAAWFISLPFQIYATFKIEQRYGFNTTTARTFILDHVKALLLAVLLGGPVLYGVLWFFESLGTMAWAVSWGMLTLFQLFIVFIAPVVIFPLFNKMTPLPDGELKTAIESYAHAQQFRIQGIFTMDSSKRSTKGNAFFTGFGKFRRIVLFDTLISKHTTEELVAVVAHEIGHYKKGHIFKQLVLSILTQALMFYLLSLLINNPVLFKDLGMDHTSIYASLVFFGMLYSPASRIISLFSHSLSRKYEFEADQYSVITYPKPGILAAALKKLSVDNLSNLTPYPLKVFVDYTHPPILQRLYELK